MSRLFRALALCALAMLAGGAAPASAKVKVVTTNQDLAWLARTIGGENAEVDFLAYSTQDPHLVEPRPSFVNKLARADMLVRIGMDLDLWVESLQNASANSKIGYNGRGFVDASRGIRPLQVPTRKVDPSQGDLHVFGNPHYFSGPTQLSVVARNIADGFIRVDAANKATYEANYRALTGRLSEALKGWRARLAPFKGKGVVTYHQSLIYLLTDFGLVEAANVEPRPGLEPTPGHVAGVARDMKADGVRVILTEDFRPRRYTNLLVKQTGAKLVVIPGGIGGEKGVDDYFAYIGVIVDRLAAALG